MRYKTHAVGGLLTGLVGVKVLNSVGVDLDILNQTILISTSTMGSFLPDIDHKGSYIGRRAKISSSIISTLFGHRGATHSPIPVSIFVLGMYYLFSKFIISNPIVKIAFFGLYIGIMSHIFLDMITKGGIPLLYPFSKKKFALTNIKTGSIYENIILFTMVIVSLSLITIR